MREARGPSPDILLGSLPKGPGGRVMIAGVGNSLRGDDGVGPLLIERLRGKAGCALLDCSQAPENYAQAILDYAPDFLIIVDAADWQGRPGEIREIPEEWIVNSSLSTHHASLRLLLAYLKRHLPGTGMVVLGIQGKDRGFLEPMSPEVKQAVQTLEEAFARWAPGEKVDSQS